MLELTYQTCKLCPLQERQPGRRVFRACNEHSITIQALGQRRPEQSGRGMNVAGQSSRGVIYAAFNQDFTCIALGTKQGIRIFRCDSCACCYEKADGALGAVERLFSTSLVAVVGAGEQPSLSPRRLNLFYTATGVSVAELNVVSSILAVRMNRKRLIVVLEWRKHIQDLDSTQLLETVDTAPNPKGRRPGPFTA